MTKEEIEKVVEALEKGLQQPNLNEKKKELIQATIQDIKEYNHLG